MDNAQRVAGLIIAQGGQALAIKTDVCKSSDVKEMVRQVVEKFGRVDMLVNNVGVPPKGPKGEGLRTWLISDEEWDFTIRLNLTSAFYCASEVIPHMIQQKGGRIMLMSSAVGKGGAGGGTAIAPYGAGKDGTMMRASASPESNERAIQYIPMKRFGKPSELAESVYFLVSPRSSYITGEILDCNGGMLMD